MTDDTRLHQQFEDEDEKIFGLYRTDKGRRFLQDAYSHYRERAGFGDRKVAIRIADDNVAEQLAEVERTKSAPKPSGEKGKKELWDKEAEKSLRVLRRLEFQMMLEPDIAEILSDQAIRIKLLYLGNALALFFYRHLGSKQRAKIRSDFLKIHGVYNVQKIFEKNTWFIEDVRVALDNI